MSVQCNNYNCWTHPQNFPRFMFIHWRGKLCEQNVAEKHGLNDAEESLIWKIFMSGSGFVWWCEESLGYLPKSRRHRRVSQWRSQESYVGGNAARRHCSARNVFHSENRRYEVGSDWHNFPFDIQCKNKQDREWQCKCDDLKKLVMFQDRVGARTDLSQVSGGCVPFCGAWRSSIQCRIQAPHAALQAGRYVRVPLFLW